MLLPSSMPGVASNCFYSILEEWNSGFEFPLVVSNYRSENSSSRNEKGLVSEKRHFKNC